MLFPKSNFYTICCFLSVSAFAVSAQLDSSFIRKNNIGWTFAVNKSYKAGDDDSPRPQWGLRTGISSFRFLSKKLFLSYALNFVYNVTRFETGFNQTISSVIANYSKQYTIIENDYSIALPVNVNYVLKHIKNKKYFIGAGIETSHLFRDQGSVSQLNSTTSYDRDFISQRYNWSLFGNIKVGYIANIFTRDTFILAFAYQDAISKMVRPEKFGTTTPIPIYNDSQFRLSTLTVLLDYLF
jgi:hypothetical protein